MTIDKTMQQASDLAFNDIQEGDTFLVERCFTAQDVDRFAQLSGDFSPLHVDASYAATTRFKNRVVHGMLLASQFSYLVGMRIPGKPALYTSQDLAFRRPVLVDEVIVARAKVLSKNAPTHTLVLATEIRNSRDEIVVSGTAKVKVREETTGLDSEGPFSQPSGRDTTLPAVEHDRVALVTGASGGIGSEIAQTLARRHTAVIIHYHRNAEAAQRLVETIAAAGGTAIAVSADVRRRQEVDALVDKALNTFGRLDWLVNGAVGELHQKPFNDLSWEDFAHHLEHQVHGALNVCQAAHPHIKAVQGAIVNILSQVVSHNPPTNMADYVTAKYALQGMSRALAAEWAADRIRINTVSPGLTRTDLTQFYNERIFKMEATRTPLRRLATARDIAQTVAFLLSDEAQFLTGVDISITGGQVIGD